MTPPTPEKAAAINAPSAIATARLKAEVGLDVSSVYDLVNSQRSFPEAVPVLLDLLDEIEEPRVLEGVIRALCDEAARGTDAVPRLIKKYRQVAEKNDSVGSAIANTLDYIATKDEWEQVIELAYHRDYGEARGLLPYILRHAPRDRAIEEARQLLFDPDTAVAVMRTIVKRRITELLEDVRRVRDETDSEWVRGEAKKAVRRLEKIAADRDAKKTTG